MGLDVFGEADRKKPRWLSGGLLDFTMGVV
jgi:hypothetical protein